MDVFAGACCWYSTWIVRSVPNQTMCYGVLLVYQPSAFFVATDPVATTIDSHSACGESLHPMTSRVPSHFEETTPSETRSTKSRGSGGVCNQVIDVWGKALSVRENPQLRQPVTRSGNKPETPVEQHGARTWNGHDYSNSRTLAQ